MSLKAADNLVNFIQESLENSSFFNNLKTGNHTIEHLQNVFGQYYLWRNRFHRWFGVCIAKSNPFGTEFCIDKILLELTEHIEEEIKQDHHGLCLEFLKDIGITSPELIELLPITENYSDSFIMRFQSPSTSFEDAIAALAGRELVAPFRNRIISDAMLNCYGKDTLYFWKLHESLELEHFNGFWKNILNENNEENLINAAKNEIREHIQFWDNISGYYVKMFRNYKKAA